MNRFIGIITFFVSVLGFILMFTEHRDWTILLWAGPVGRMLTLSFLEAKTNNPILVKF